MCSDDESPMPSHRECKNITKVFPYNLENMIYIVSKRRKFDSIKKQYPNAIICDVTSTSPNSLVKLSPFYPHMNIPIPFSPNYTGASVEGIWQGLKVFVDEDIDILPKNFEILSNRPKSFYNTAGQAKPFLISVLDKPGFRADIPRFRPRNQCGSNSG